MTIPGRYPAVHARSAKCPLWVESGGSGQASWLPLRCVASGHAPWRWLADLARDALCPARASASRVGCRGDGLAPRKRAFLESRHWRRRRRAENMTPTRSAEVAAEYVADWNGRRGV